MNDTDKLLRALIDALGFDIEEMHGGRAYCKCSSTGILGCRECQGTGFVASTTSYKLTKRNVATVYTEKEVNIISARLISGWDCWNHSKASPD